MTPMSTPALVPEDGQPTILIVDDSPDSLAFLSGLLKESYRIRVANNGEKGLRLAGGERPPDLVLLDVVMPGLDGHEVCQRLKADPRTRDIPVIFLTSLGEVEDERRGLELGAADYITKPISPPILMARVQTQLRLKATSDFLRDKNEFLEQEVSRRTREIVAMQEVTILALAAIAETRDADTGFHLRRTQLYVKALAQKVSSHPRFQAYLTPQNIDLLVKSTPLHDIGKVGIPDRILLKPAPLTNDEFDVMKSHTTLGRDALMQAEKALGVDLEFLNAAKEIALYHHEKWGGHGYPFGLGGDDIPVSARLMAIADVYDALVSRRVYKGPMSHEQAVQMITDERGRHFDPDLVDGFLEIRDQFQEIADRYADTDEDLLRKAEYRARAVPA